MEKEFSSEFIRAHINTIILRCLFSGEKYGYEIYKYIIERSNGSLELKQPTLYACLRRLETMKLISSYWKNSEIGGKRHYYAITSEGIYELNKNRTEWEKSRNIIDGFISAGAFSNDKLSVENEKILKDINELKNDVNFSADRIYTNLQDESRVVDKFIKNEFENQPTFFEKDMKDVNVNILKFKNTMQKLSKQDEDQIKEDFREKEQFEIEEVKEKLQKETTIEKNETISNKGFIENHISEINDAVFLPSDSPTPFKNRILESVSNESRYGEQTSSCDDGVFYNQNLPEYGQPFSYQSNFVKRETLKDENKKIPNDAVFISERTIYSELQNQNSEYENDLNGIELNYVVSPLNIKEQNRAAVYDEMKKEKRALVTSFSVKPFDRELNKPLDICYVKTAKINLISSFILFVLMLCEFLVLKFVISNFNLATNFTSLIMTTYLIFSFVMLTISIFIYCLNPNKTGKRERKFSILFGFTLFIVSFIIIVSINNFFGMPSITNEEYLISWIAPTTLCFNIFITPIIFKVLCKTNQFNA